MWRGGRGWAASAGPPRSSATGWREPPMAGRAYYTSGYEKARLADVIAALSAAGVAALIDVRDRPISRRPGFSKRQLAATLEEAGIDYVGLRALGTPPEGRMAGRARQWDRFWRIVEHKLASAEA